MPRNKNTFEAHAKSQIWMSSHTQILVLSSSDPLDLFAPLSKTIEINNFTEIPDEFVWFFLLIPFTLFRYNIRRTWMPIVSVILSDSSASKCTLIFIELHHRLFISIFH